MELTREQILELMVSILGSNIDGATWTSDGPAGDRNELLTTERVITRVLNDFDARILSALSTVDGFKTRFDEVVGKNYTDDAETFDEIGSNLIIAVNDLKNYIANLTEEDIPDIAIAKIKNLQNILDGKVDSSKVLTDVPADAVFTDTVYEHPLNHSISEITDLQGILDNKADNSRILTDVPINAKFTDTVYIHPDNHPISIIDELQDVLDNKVDISHNEDPDAHADLIVIKDVGNFENLNAAFEYIGTNQLTEGFYKLKTDLTGDGPMLDCIACIYGSSEEQRMSITLISSMSIMRAMIDLSTMTVVRSMNAFRNSTIEFDYMTRIMKNYMLLASEWTQGDTYYELQIHINDMTEDGIADVNIRLEDLEMASVIKSANNSFDGYIVLYADEIPEGDIQCDIKYTIPVPGFGRTPIGPVGPVGPPIV